MNSKLRFFLLAFWAMFGTVFMMPLATLAIVTFDNGLFGIAHFFQAKGAFAYYGGIFAFFAMTIGGLLGIGNALYHSITGNEIV